MTEETAAYGSYDEFLRHKFAAYSHDDMRKLSDLFDSWYRNTIGPNYSIHIRPVTDPEHDEMERHYFLKRLREANYEAMDLERLRRLSACLPKGE